MRSKRGLLVLVLGLFLIANVLAIDVPGTPDVEITYPTNGSYYDSEVTYIDVTISGDNLTNCWWNDGTTDRDFNCEDTRISSDVSSDEDWNTWEVYANSSLGTDSDEVEFWTDTIELVLDVLTPASGTGYTNGDLLSLLVQLTETNKGGYNGVGIEDGSSNYIYRKFYYPEFSGSEEGSYALNADNESNCSLTPSVLNEGNYTYEITAREVDPDGTTIRDETISGVIIRDITDPSVSVDEPANDSNHVGTVEIETSASDALSGVAEMQVRVYNTSDDLMDSTTCNDAEECDLDWDSSTEIDGTYYIIATARDNADNTDTTDPVIIDVDNTAPEIYFVSPDEDVYNSNQTVNITASDYNLNLIELYVNEVVVANSTTQELIYELGEGSYNVSGKAYDSFGNENETETREIIIDMTPPSLDNAEVSPSIFSATLGQEVDVIMNASEIIEDWGRTYVYNSSGDSVKYFNGPSDIESNVETWDGKNSSGDLVDDGNYTINTTIEDRAGNSATVYVGIVTVDNSPPVTVDDAPRAWQTSDVEVNLTAGDALSGVADTLYCVDQINACVPSTSGTSITVSDEGTNYVRYHSIDNVGNEEIVASATVQIDKTGPNVNLTSPSDNEPFGLADNDVDLIIEADDALNSIDNCSLIFNGELNQTVAGEDNFTINDLEAGQYNWSVECRDDLNNLGESETRYFTILANVSFDDGSNFTDLESESDITNVSYFYVVNTFGMINWSNPIDFSSGVDWGACINISENRIEVNSSCFAGFNTDAVVTLYNLSWTNPQVLKDDSVCDTCSEISYENGTFVFSVSGFSVYTTRETPASPSPGSGGSSSSSSDSSTCTTDWTCTGWSECVDGEQIRTCSKTDSSCVTANTMPAELKYCVVDSSDESDDESEEDVEEGAVEQQGLVGRITGAITGAAVGTGARKTVTITILTLVVLAGIYFGVKHKIDKRAK